MKGFFWFMMGLIVMFGIFVGGGAYTANKDNRRYERAILKMSESYFNKREGDYQISLHMDTVWIWDGNRLVGSYISNWRNQMDTIILKHNQ